MFLSAVDPGSGVLLSIRPSRLGGKVESAYEEFDYITMMVLYRVNVSDSSGTGSSRLSRTKGH